MAESVLGPVIEKLVELLSEKVKSVKGVQREVKILKDELEIIQPFLIDAEAKLEKGELNDATKVWLKQIREVAVQIEDVVDEHLHHLARHHQQNGFIGILQEACHNIKALKLCYGIASEIQDIKELLREIKERGQMYGLKPFEQGSSSKKSHVDTPVDPRLGSLFIEEDELVGIDSMSNTLIRNLIDGPPTRMVISLVGEGGIGKTTLAKKVYEDKAVKAHFHCHAWITVSQSYNLEKILKTMINQICQTNREQRVDAIEGLIGLLRRDLKTKRYVVVFDDVWQTDFWGYMKDALPSNDKGARIIITTRKTTVAESFKMTQYDVVQELRTWSWEYSWELFCKKTFSFGLGGCPQELEELSHQIVSKCQGLPLVIVAVAGLLTKKENNKLEWQRVLDHLTYEFEENEQLIRVLKVLSFSYHDLPYHLKSCFLYFGIFPEDYAIFEKRLYRLWIAEGFVKLKRGKTLEEVAEEYLNELICRNLVSFEIKYGSERWCRVHDLLREIILARANELDFYQIFNKSKLRFKRKSRRLSINDTTKDVLKCVAGSKIRSIFLFNINELTNSFVVNLFANFKLLTVLDFHDAPLYKLPKEVGNLYNLKHLSLEGTCVKRLPRRIGKLQNLQTLNLLRTFVQELPVEIKKLRNLRHLLAYQRINYELEYSYASHQGVRIHEGIGSLEELQTLAMVEAYPSRVGFIEELDRLTKLKALSISNLTAETGKALGKSIVKMNQLEKLYLYAVNEDEILDLKCISSPLPFLRNLDLRFQLQQLSDWMSGLQSLQGLDLSFSRLIEEPLKHLKGLPNLAYLHLHQAYDGEELHFEEGGFQKLKKLRLRKLEGLKVLKIDEGALPLLENLDFGPSPLMKEMPSDIQHLTNLKSLVIFDMPTEFVSELQPDEGLDYWKIQHIPFVTFWFKFRGENYETYKLGEPDLLELCKSVDQSTAMSVVLEPLQE